MSTDKLKMNQRFRHVYHELVKRNVLIESGRTKKGQINVSELTRIMGTYSGIIPAILADKRYITEQMITHLCSNTELRISELYLRMGIGEPFEDTRQYMGNNIKYAGVPATAGDNIGAEPFESVDAFGIPGLDEDLYAFSVIGNSMDPILAEGDMVFCKQVDDKHRIRPNKIYAVAAEGVVRIKYVRFDKNEFGEETILRLLSENSASHPPILVELNEAVRFYEVRYTLTTIENRMVHHKNWLYNSYPICQKRLYCPVAS